MLAMSAFSCLLDSWILEKQLDLISNRSALWTDFGLKSLAKTSTLYMIRNTEHDPPYWRGTIWMNMNYLVLSSLNHYSKVDGPYRGRAKTVYSDLRDNLISMIRRMEKEKEKEKVRASLLVGRHLCC
ncbi:mannosyl-oligosaccharide glucosidase GCS1-like isoform X2 [Olea europaea var. sylvestris]|uniref:mannosyl-oligosaccharide glucosidase GCS1-like isoform X2 n=1 Tax=Olea europaea var. sylvestris TaxID=158386 RepID=UPI000C1CCF92|nr:mannosyl-oligosaccharide glucosidase GCS1-like isoform X2 [Olea europaea var. sylvestris]